MEMIHETVKRDVRALMAAALDERTPLVGEAIDVPRPVCPRWLGDAFGAVANVAQVRALVMNVRSYADMRTFGRDVLDIESLAWVLKTGIQAHLWDVPVIAGPSCLRGVGIWVVGQREDGTWVKQELRVVRDA